MHVCAGNREMAARINMWTTVMLDFEGANAVLFCRSEGNPRPTVTWLDRDDRHITSSSSNHDDQYLVREFMQESRPSTSAASSHLRCWFGFGGNINKTAVAIPGGA